MCEQLDNKNIKQLLNIVGSFVSISMTDRDGVITCVSDAFCKLTGYTKDELLGKQVLCVTNFPPKKIAGFISEVLTTGVVLADNSVILAVPDKPAPNGLRLL